MDDFQSSSTPLQSKIKAKPPTEDAAGFQKLPAKPRPKPRPVQKTVPDADKNTVSSGLDPLYICADLVSQYVDEDSDAQFMPSRHRGKKITAIFSEESDDEVEIIASNIATKAVMQKKAHVVCKDKGAPVPAVASKRRADKIGLSKPAAVPPIPDGRTAHQNVQPRFVLPFGPFHQHAHPRSHDTLFFHTQPHLPGKGRPWRISNGQQLGKCHPSTLTTQDQCWQQRLHSHVNFWSF